MKQVIKPVLILIALAALVAALTFYPPPDPLGDTITKQLLIARQ